MTGPGADADTRCKVDGCTLKVSLKKHQLCVKHYQAFHKYGDPNGSPNLRAGGPCSVPDCVRRRSSREGLCGTHRQRLLRTGSLDLPTRPQCSDAECTKPAVCKGMCQMHYDRARKSYRRSERTCAAEGCEETVKARGRCQRHYSELQRTRTLASAPLRSEELGTGGTCTEDGCDRPATAKRRCNVHYTRVRSGINTERLCRTCGSDLTGLSRGFRYCSDDCKPRCSGPDCDRMVTGRGLCSSHLKQHNRGETLQAIKALVKRAPNSPCEWCGTPVGEGSTSRFCAVTCQGLARRHATMGTVGECAQCGATIDYLAPANGGGTRLTPVSKRLCDDCRHRSASLYLSADEIRKRDGDDCRICGLPVPMDALKPHPLAPEVDHVIPISQGGTHDPDNLALTHKTCNITKGGTQAPDWRRDPAEVAPLIAEWEEIGMAMLRPECSADGCDRRVQAKGMCDKHYRRVRANGTTELPARPSVCSSDGCDKSVRARGMCKPHYARFLRSRYTCSVTGCDKEAHTRELCKRHYNQWLLNRPDHPQCSDAECTRPSEVRGMCNLHYTRWRTAQREGASVN